MTNDSDECVVVERVFARPTGESLVLRIFKPQMLEEDHWVCRYSITDITESRRVYGVDSLQALEGALKVAAVELEGWNRRNGPLTWFDSPDLEVWPPGADA